MLILCILFFLRLGYWSLERLINKPFVEPRFEFICLAQSPNAYPLNHTNCVFVIQFCLTFCNPMECSLQGSSLYGIPKAKILEWILIPFSRGYSWIRDQTRASHTAGRFFTVWTTTEVPCPFHFFKSYYLSVKRLWKNKDKNCIIANVYSVWYCLLGSMVVIFMDILLLNTQQY